MDIVTIYGQPDEAEPLKAFEGLMKSFKKYGFRNTDRLIILGPNFQGEKLDKMHKMLGLISGEGHKFVPFSYRNGRAGRSLAEYHNYCMCVASRHVVGEGNFLYLPFGCEPNEKGWGKSVETVMNMHTDKSFIGETRLGANGFPYLSGACVLPYTLFSKGTVFQAVNSKVYALERCNMSCRGGVLHYDFPFTSIDFVGAKVEEDSLVKWRKEKPDKEAEELIPDVAEDVSEEVMEVVADIIAPEPEPEPEVPDTFLEDELKAVEETEEAPKPEKPKKKAAKKKRAAKKGAKKKTAKKAAKKAVKKPVTGIPATETKSAPAFVPFGGALPRAEKTERVDHSL